MKVVIVVDSGADLLEKYENVITVGLKVIFGDNEYREDDLSYEQFFEMAKENHPTTSAPSLYDYEVAYKQAISDGATVIVCIPTTKKHSKSNENALLAKKSIQNPNVQIFVVDSKKISLQIGFAVEKLQKLIERGATIEKMLESLEQYYTLLVGIEDLLGLKRGGRLSGAGFILGSLVSLKPIVQVNKEGKIVPIESIRTSKKLMSAMVKRASKLGPEKIVKIAIPYANNIDKAKEFRTMLVTELLNKGIKITEDDIQLHKISKAVAVHSWIDSYGVCIELKS